ncbi:MAG TPA: hypothetical protein VF509_11730 [Sphingobium sp.]
MTTNPAGNEGDGLRSNRTEVRNPVLALPTARILAAIDPDTRTVLAWLLSDLQQDARSKSRQSWDRRKAFTAAYWAAVATYAGHIRRALGGAGSDRVRMLLLVRQPGFPDVPAHDWADASRCYCDRRDRYGLGVSEFPEGELAIGDRVIARISYNGRIWLAGPWHPGDKPLYDNWSAASAP